MKTVRVKVRIKMPVDVDVEVSLDRLTGEATVMGGEISPTFIVRPRAIYENFSQGDFQKLDRETKDKVLEEALDEWRKHVDSDPSRYPEEGIRTLPLPLTKWGDIVQRESGLHMRIHIAGVVGYLKDFEVLAEPVLEREPSMYLWEINPGSGEFDRVEKHIKSQLNQAMTKRMPDGSMRVYWKNRN